MLVGADVGVNLRGSDGAVSEDMLYVAYVHVFLQQLCSEGMAEHMGRQMLGDFQCLLITGNQQAYGLLGEWISELVDKEEAAGLDFFLKHGAVGIENFQYIRVADLQDALLCTFSIDANILFTQVDFLIPDMAELGDSHAGGKKKLHDGGIADTYLALVAGFTVLHFIVNAFEDGGKVRVWYGSGKQAGLPKGGAQTAHGIDFHQIMKNKIGEQGVNAGNLAFYGFGFLVFPVQMQDVGMERFLLYIICIVFHER